MCTGMDCTKTGPKIEPSGTPCLILSLSDTKFFKLKQGPVTCGTIQLKNAGLCCEVGFVVSDVIVRISGLTLGFEGGDAGSLFIRGTSMVTYVEKWI